MEFKSGYRPSIGCNKCLLCFDGEVICMSCAAGFKFIDLDGERSNHSFGLMRIFVMHNELVGNKVRVKFDTEKVVTDVEVPFTTFTTTEFGFETKKYKFQFDECLCPMCDTASLENRVADNSICPNCNNPGLYRSGSFVSWW